jgi:hypothetical protein
MPPGIYKRKPRPPRPIEWLKECSRCERMQTLNDFYPDGTKFDGVHTICKTCIMAYQNERRAKDPDKYRDYCREYAAKPENVLKAKAKRYNITVEQYEAMKVAQGNACAACRDSFEGLDEKHIHVDHDHACCPKNKSCGKCVRAILCWHCNAALGMLRDEAWRVDALGWYLLESQSKNPHLAELHRNDVCCDGCLIDA